MLSATLLVGCSLMALSDFSGGDQAAPDGSVSDAFSSSTDVTDATDAAFDAPVVPEPTDGDAMPAPFCASLSPQPSVCLDFDGDPAFGSWVVDNAKGSKVEASSGAFVSAPRAGHFSGAGAGGGMTLRYALATAGAPNTLVLDADVRIDVTAPDDELDIMTVILPVGDDSIELQLSTDSGAYRLQRWSFSSDGGEVVRNVPFQRAVALGKWQHLRFTVQLATAGKALLEIDGVPAPEATFTLPDGIGVPTLELGDGYLLGGASAFYMDNFTATLK